MSVLVPDPEVFNYIHNGLELAAYRRTCDEFYCYALHRHFENTDIHKESKRLIKSWMELNNNSWNASYNEKKDESLYKFVKFELVNVRPLQLLKYLKCLHYNIEIETIQTSEIEIGLKDIQDYKLLESWIDQLKSAIIDKIPEYDQAKWSEKPEKSVFKFQN